MGKPHSCWRVTAMACLVFLTLAGTTRAQEKSAGPLDRQELDRRIYYLLKDVINTGADLYNGLPDKAQLPDPSACTRLWQGALMTLQPLLDHRPDLQKTIEVGLEAAERTTEIRRRAFALRAVINEIRDKVATLWDRLGGEKNVTKIVDDFVTTAAADPKVNFFRDGKLKDKVDVPKLKRLLVEFFSGVSGGPLKYTGRGMKEAHPGMGITDAEFDALAGHLQKALEKNGVKPADVERVLKLVNDTRKEIVEEKKPASK